MPYLIAALQQEDVLPVLVLVDVVYHSFGLEVGELDWEGLEGVAFRHVVFDGGLEFFVSEGLTADSLKLIVA